MESIRKYASEEQSSNQLATITATGNTDGYFNVPFDGKLIGAWIGGVDALAANNTNFLTFSLVNINNSNAPMLSAADVNTTKLTGSALGANVTRELVLNETPANLQVSAKQRLRFRAGATGTLANTVTFPVVTLVFQRA